MNPRWEFRRNAHTHTLACPAVHQQILWRMLQDGSLDADCMKRFEELQQCMTVHPEAFAEFANFQQGGTASRLADSVQ
jgi:hypothetical protein